MRFLAFLGPFGLLPLGLALGAWGALGWGAACFPRGWRAERLLAGVTCALAFASAAPRALAAASACRPPALLMASAAFALAGRIAARRRGAAPFGPWPAWAARGAAAWAAALAAAVVGAAAAAAYYLPVWHYDSLSYHLPFVNFVLQDGDARGVPADVPYLGSYPHAVEWSFVLFRAWLPDDRLVDLAQVPFGLAGAGATFAVARTAGAARGPAAAAAACWLALPAVFLQLPTDYIDVASAAFYLLAAFFLLRPPSPARLALAGLAAGLFLGAKPSAPLGLAVLGAWALWRARGRGLGTPLASAALGAALLGAESYVTNVARHGNPVWPVAVGLGPLRLPGPVTLATVLSSGAGTERAHGSLAARVLASWGRLDASPAFDMRVGGLSAPALVALAALAFWAARTRRLGLAVLAAGACASPDPAVVRYVLPLPALALAAGAAVASRWAPGRRAWAVAGALGASAASAAFAARGLVGEGPPLWAYPGMTWAERAEAVGAEGRPTPWLRLRERLADGEAVGFDLSFELRALLWRPDLGTRAVFLDGRAPAGEQLARAARERVRFVILGDDSPLARAGAGRLAPLFRCTSAPCAAYEVL
jgi:hypothetical protein